jgi:hypothetical protein
VKLKLKLIHNNISLRLECVKIKKGKHIHTYCVVLFVCRHDTISISFIHETVKVCQMFRFVVEYQFLKQMSFLLMNL